MKTRHTAHPSPTIQTLKQLQSIFMKKLHTTKFYSIGSTYFKVHSSSIKKQQHSGNQCHSNLATQLKGQLLSFLVETVDMDQSSTGAGVKNPIRCLFYHLLQFCNFVAYSSSCYLLCSMLQLLHRQLKGNFQINFHSLPFLVVSKVLMSKNNYPDPSQNMH